MQYGILHKYIVLLQLNRIFVKKQRGRKQQCIVSCLTISNQTPRTGPCFPETSPTQGIQPSTLRDRSWDLIPARKSSQIHSLSASENIVQLFGVPQVCSRFVKKSQLYSNQHTFLIHPFSVMKCQQSIIENFNQHPLLSVIIFTSASTSLLQVVNQRTRQIQQDSKSWISNTQGAIYRERCHKSWRILRMSPLPSNAIQNYILSLLHNMMTIRVVCSLPPSVLRCHSHVQL